MNSCTPSYAVARDCLTGYREGRGQTNKDAILTIPFLLGKVLLQDWGVGMRRN